MSDSDHMKKQFAILPAERCSNIIVLKLEDGPFCGQELEVPDHLINRKYERQTHIYGKSDYDTDYLVVRCEGSIVEEIVFVGVCTPHKKGVKFNSHFYRREGDVWQLKLSLSTCFIDVPEGKQIKKAMARVPFAYTPNDDFMSRLIWEDKNETGS